MTTLHYIVVKYNKDLQRRLPFEVKAPNAATRKAIAELETGKGKKFKSVKALMKDLNLDTGNVLLSR